jgi:hypothetical protein
MAPEGIVSLAAQTTAVFLLLDPKPVLVDYNGRRTIDVANLTRIWKDAIDAAAGYSNRPVVEKTDGGGPTMNRMMVVPHGELARSVSYVG